MIFKWRAALYVALISVIAILTTSLFSTSNEMRATLAAKKDQFHKNVMYFTSRFERELLQFIVLANKYHRGDQTVSRDDLVERFDIFRSRVSEIDKGALGRFDIEIPGNGGLQQAATAALESVEPIVVDGFVRDVKTAAKIEAFFQPLLKRFRRVSLRIDDFENNEQSNVRSLIQDWIDDSLLVFSGLLAFGAILIVLISVDSLSWSRRLRDIQKARDGAEKASNAKSQFLSSMSHELRTPLNAIMGFGQMLELNPKEPLTADQKVCVYQIMNSSKHLLELIDKVLDLSRIEAGNLGLALEPVWPSDLFREVLEMVRPMAEQRGITLNGEKKSDKLLMVDPFRLKQVIVNLVSNAVKYNLDKGSVNFGCWDKEGNIVRIFVTDTGQGIPPEKQAGLFEPFNRLGKEASEIEGTGIGLSLTRQLVEAMGGRIGFESDVGVGSTFWVEFPAFEHKTGDSSV